MWKIPFTEKKLTKAQTWLIAIFLLTLTVRLVLAFTIPNLTYESYFHVKQVEHITEFLSPMFNDPLSYGGRDLTFLPFFHYLMALFNLILPLWLVVKLIPNLLIATLPILAYFIAKKISQNETASLYSALTVGFLPILFSTNSFTPAALFLPLVFLNIYAFLNINNNSEEKIGKNKYLILYVITFLLLSFTSFATFLLLMGFLIYLVLSLLEGKRINKVDLELILFSLFFFVWTQFVFFKNVLIKEGMTFIWHNIPTAIFSQYFPKLSIIEAIVLVSVIPFLSGIHVVYRSLFHLKNKKTFLLISFVISTSLLTWLRLIEFKLSLAFFGVILAILFASFYKDMTNYIKKTKFSHLQKKWLPYIIITLLLLTMVFPALSTSFQQDIPTDNDIAVFTWINKQTPQTAGILASLEEGHLVTYYGQRKNLMDDQFGLVDDADERFSALSLLFGTPLQTQAIESLNKYNIQYLVLTPHSKEKYDVDKFQYLSKKCFELVYNNETQIYHAKCAMRPVLDQ